MTRSGFLEGVEIVGVTSTYYRDRSDPRFGLAIEAAEKYQSVGIPLIAVDSSPGQATNETWVQDELESRDALVFRADIGGIASQRRQAVIQAAELGADKVLSHEAEKVLAVDFAPEALSALDDVDLLVVGRTTLAEASLPPVQRRTERLAGWILEQTHGLPADTLCGVRGFNRTGMDYMARYPAHRPEMNNWLYLHTTLLDAIKDGASVGGIVVDLVHPQAMVEQETDNPVFDRKRYDQFVLQLNWLIRNRTVSVEALSIAEATMAAVEGYDDSMSNGEFHAKLSHLETELVDYTPAD